MTETTNKHFIMPKLLQQQVTISLVGCGGNGSQMLTGLARLHMALLACGHPHGLYVTAYDPDTVSVSNVGRQLFSPADVGQSKACVLVNRLNLFYGLGWRGYPIRFEGVKSAGDIVISCTDSAKSRREIYQFMEQHPPVYWLDVGNRSRDGQVILGQTHALSLGVVQLRARATAKELNAKKALEKSRLPHVFDYFPELKSEDFQEDDTPSCSLAEALERQDLFINQAVVTFALDLLWRLFRDGRIERHGAFINLESGDVTPLPVPMN